MQPDWKDLTNEDSRNSLHKLLDERGPRLEEIVAERDPRWIGPYGAREAATKHCAWRMWRE